eukprot:819386_1
MPKLDRKNPLLVNKYKHSLQENDPVFPQRVHTFFKPTVRLLNEDSPYRFPILCMMVILALYVSFEIWYSLYTRRPVIQPAAGNFNNAEITISGFNSCLNSCDEQEQVLVWLTEPDPTNMRKPDFELYPFNYGGTLCIKRLERNDQKESGVFNSIKNAKDQTVWVKQGKSKVHKITFGHVTLTMHLNEFELVGMKVPHSPTRVDFHDVNLDAKRRSLVNGFTEKLARATEYKQYDRNIINMIGKYNGAELPGQDNNPLLSVYVNTFDTVTEFDQYTNYNSGQYENLVDAVKGGRDIFASYVQNNERIVRKVHVLTCTKQECNSCATYGFRTS